MAKGTWQAEMVEHVILGVMSLNPMSGMEITLKKSQY